MVCLTYEKYETSKYRYTYGLITYRAVSKGLSLFSSLYGTRPIMTVHMAMYTMIEMINEMIVARGIFLQGCFASCATLKTVSNPTYAKKVNVDA
jgi:hypothetical protein